jgi:hypothetical protein
MAFLWRGEGVLWRDLGREGSGTFLLFEMKGEAPGVQDQGFELKNIMMLKSTRYS